MEIKIPSVGESVFEALVASWHKKDGDRVAKDEPLCEIETDKISMDLNAEASGILSIKVPAGTTVKIGTVIGNIDEQAPAEAAGEEEKREETGTPEQPEVPTKSAPPLSPAVRKLAMEKGVNPEEIAGTGRGGRVTVEDLLNYREEGRGKREEEKQGPGAGDRGPERGEKKPEEVAPERGEEGRVTRKPMSPLRRRIAERLLAARQQTAMLTTFNEADMSRIVALRKRHKEDFSRRHGVPLGFMPFFIKACVEALQEFPAVNARIEGTDLVFQHFYDIGIAVSGEKGLVVPVLRDADRLGFVAMEKAIEDFVEREKTNRLNLSDLEGGTFTISNGGVYGSLLSTPIINPPQSAVLGMHAVQERPVARDGKVEIRPMMYLALSYDHRIIDGREAVQFLKRVKGYVEEPEEMLLES